MHWTVPAPAQASAPAAAQKAALQIAPPAPTAFACAEYTCTITAVGATVGPITVTQAPLDLALNITMPMGQLNFNVTGVSAGSAVTLYVDTPSAAHLSDFYALTSGSSAWQSQSASVAALDATRTRVAFAITDGGAFDADGAANGSISVVGGPVIDYFNMYVRMYVSDVRPRCTSAKIPGTSACSRRKFW
ncbi:MAG: hypothetical protein NTZ50_12800 [Chloroflexi bacterium]|nr:hypothetical protein [Chloroflexota bacterium]